MRRPVRIAVRAYRTLVDGAPERTRWGVWVDWTEGNPDLLRSWWETGRPLAERFARGAAKALALPIETPG